MPDSVVEAEGGRDAVIADLKQSLQELAQDGATVVRVEIEPPDRIVPARDELYAILRQTVVVHVPAGEVFAASYLVGVAHRGTAAWKFVDGGSLSQAQVQQLLPNLPPELELPEVAKPRLVPTDRAVRE